MHTSTYLAMHVAYIKVIQTVHALGSTINGLWVEFQSLEILKSNCYEIWIKKAMVQVHFNVLIGY